MVVSPRVVRDLWHEWMIDLEDGEAVRKKSTQEERRRRREEEEELRVLERRNEQEQQNFEKIMAAMSQATERGGSR